jgi:glycosyltransferase involved in cell wall biosynthesis
MQRSKNHRICIGTKMTKYAILISHPIQYLVPLFQALSEHKTISTEIWCNNDFGNKPFYDPDFRKTIKWDIDVVEGYNRRLLKNFSLWPSTSFFGQINPSVITLLFSTQRPDVLMVWGWNSVSHVMAILVAKTMGVKLYLRAETTLEYEKSLPFTKRVIKKVLLSLFFKGFDGFFYLGTQNFQFYKYMDVSHEKLHFMPYCTTRFSKSMSQRKLDKIRKFLFVGKLTPKKRPDIVIEAFRCLCRKHPKMALELTIVGDGQMRNAISKTCDADDRLNFHGFANQSELQDIYQKHDAIILPSDERETWGLVINEALANGLAAIASDRVGCRDDLIKTDRNGDIFSYGNVDELITCMHKMVAGSLSIEQIRRTNMKLAKIYNHDIGAAAFLGLDND